MRLSFISHDYVEFKHNGKEYTVDLKHDKHGNPIGWQKEINTLKKSSLPSIQKYYKVESTTYTSEQRPLLQGFMR